MPVSCLCSLLLGVGLSTNGQFMEVDQSFSRGQIGLFHSVEENHGEKFDDTGIQGRLRLFKLSKHAEVMGGLTLGIEHHPYSEYYNETYIVSIPSLTIMTQPSISNDFKLFMSATPGKEFHTLKGDVVETKTGFDAKYNFSVGILFKIN